MDLMEKLTILSDAAKYDAACTSSGVDRSPSPGGIGNSTACGICHSFAADGRCISLLKVLMSNACVYNCQPHDLYEPMECLYLASSCCKVRRGQDCSDRHKRFQRRADDPVDPDICRNCNFCPYTCNCLYSPPEVLC